jgi:hypothetical protein
MESRENPAFGRKVFFLNPAFSTKNVIVNKLIEDEFEVYVIDDYRDVKSVLRNFPDAICFINIDDQLTHEQWFNFIKSFETDETLKSIFLGILSSRINKADRDLFMLKASIPAGFIMTNERLEDITDTIRGILNINGAKGRRQYVRTNCESDPNALMLVRIGGKMYKMHLLNISIVGAACILAPQYKNMFQANSVIRNISVMLGGKYFDCTVAVYAVISTPDYCKLVLLFMHGLSYAVKKLIRGYITDTLQKRVLDIIKANPRDIEDYSKAVESAEKQETEDEAFLLDVSDEELQDEKNSGKDQLIQDESGLADIPESVVSKFNGKPEDLSITPLF